MFIKDEKGQTAIEVILILAVVLIIVTVIGIYLKNKAVQISGKGNEDINNIITKLE